jgi:cell division control protein 45
MYGKLGLVEYTQLAAGYKEEVDRLSPTNETQDIFQERENYDNQKDPDDYSIKFIEDMQLMLVKHWNLFDSLFHSSYVGTKLGIWKQKGRLALNNLLVKMGYTMTDQISTKRIKTTI